MTAAFVRAAGAGQTITGSVKNSSGQPAAGVAVRLAPKKLAVGPKEKPPGADPSGEIADGDVRANLLSGTPGGFLRGEKPTARATTDAGGNFSFPNVAPGKYVIVAGTGSTQVRFEVEVGQAAPAPVVLDLPAEK